MTDRTAESPPNATDEEYEAWLLRNAETTPWNDTTIREVVRDLVNIAKQYKQERDLYAEKVARMEGLVDGH